MFSCMFNIDAQLCNEKLTAWQDASANAATTAQQASSIVSPSYTHITRTTNHPASCFRFLICACKNVLYARKPTVAAPNCDVHAFN